MCRTPQEANGTLRGCEFIRSTAICGRRCRKKRPISTPRKGRPTFSQSLGVCLRIFFGRYLHLHNHRIRISPSGRKPASQLVTRRFDQLVKAVRYGKDEDQFRTPDRHRKQRRFNQIRRHQLVAQKDCKPCGRRMSQVQRIAPNARSLQNCRRLVRPPPVNFNSQPEQD